MPCKSWEDRLFMAAFFLIVYGLPAVVLWWPAIQRVAA